MFLTWPLAVIQPESPVTMTTVKAAGVACRVITTDLTDQRVRVGVILADGFPGTDEPFTAMIKRTTPMAAINGAYFSKETLKPIGDIVSRGALVNKGLMGTAFTLTPENKPDIMRVIRHKTTAWGLYDTVLACGPALILDGKKDVDWKGEGFRDPHVTGSTKRMAVGYTAEQKLLFVYIDKAVTFDKEADVMAALGCQEALNLDGGASLAMSFNSKTVLSPGRRLTNLLAVWVTK